MPDDNTTISVRVLPRAGRDEIDGWRDGLLLVRLRAPPVDGRANDALVRLIASRLGIAPSRVELIAGATRRQKRLRISGAVSLEPLGERL